MKISGFSNAEIAAELKAAVLFREYDNPVQKIADMLGLKNRTVYDYFDGNIKISLPFLHACLIVTDGDPDIKKYLCPEGWDLVPVIHSENVGDVEKECGNVHIAASELLMAIRAARSDGRITPNERAIIEKAMDNVRREIIDVDAAIDKDKRVVKLAK